MIIPTLLAATLTPSFPFADRLEHVYKVPTGPVRITFHGTNGRLTIRSGRSDQIVVKQWIRADKLVKLNEVSLQEKLTGSDLRLDVQENFVTPGDLDPRYPGAISYTPPQIDITLTLPRSASLNLENTNGSISISGIQGRIRARSMNGDIRFAAQTTQVDSTYAKTFNGSISSEISLTSDPDRASVTLDSFNGKIQIRKPSPSLWLAGAQAFDGKRFRKQDWYVIDGAFTRRRPKGELTTVPLTGKFIGPPNADAHCHHLDGAYLSQQMNGQYLAEGTLYVQSMGNHTSLRDESNPVVNRPDSIDGRFANAGFTSRFGHPAFLYESLAHPTPKEMTREARGAFIRNQPRLDLGNAYWLAESAEQLAEVWPKYLAGDPDVVKVFLVDSANRDKNINGDPGTIGLDPKMIPLITRRAHLAGLEVYAHADTALDAELAFKGGVDGLAHMPGYGMGDQPADQFRIGKSLDKLVSGRFIQPTIFIAEIYAKNSLAAVRALQRENFEVLCRAGARMVIGSDNFNRTQRDEALSWLAIGQKPLDVYRALTDTTAQSIFPHRQIGRISEGYEANFVVLRSNPLQDLNVAFNPESTYKLGREVFKR